MAMRPSTPDAPDDSVPGLRFGNDTELGFRRMRSGSRFRYVDNTGRPPGDADRRRIDLLVIPPAWVGVWIACDPRSHLQATGRDARSRKQYRYHTEFRAHCEARKFTDLIEWGHHLPSIRKQVDRDLRRRRPDLAKVAALAVRLLDETSIRVGNEQYAKSNESFGLTTLRTSHVAITGSTVRLCFVGKSGKVQDIACTDARIARALRAIVDLPGEQLFHYEAPTGLHPIHSADVNAYLALATGSSFTAKTFRTWNATVLATQHLAATSVPTTRREGRSAVTEAMRAAAAMLGNTPAVARSSYVHPGVVKAFEAGELAAMWHRRGGRGSSLLTPQEARTLTVLRSIESARDAT